MPDNVDNILCYGRLVVVRKSLLIVKTSLFLLILVACNDMKIHENVDEDLAEDSIQVMNILDNALEEDVLVDDLPKEDVSKLNSYGDKYNESDRETTLIFNGTEEDIITFSLGTITRYTMYTGLESDEKVILDGKDSIEEMIKTGNEYADLDKHK